MAKLTSIGREDGRIEVVASSHKSLLGQEEQTAQGQLGQTHRVHDGVHAGAAGGEVRKVHRAVVACVCQDVARGRPSHSVDPAQRAQLQVRLAKDQWAVGVLERSCVHVRAVHISGEGTEHAHLEVRTASGQQLAVGGVERAAQHGTFKFLLNHLANPPLK